MNMRRITVGLSAAVLALAVAGCGTQDDPTSKPSASDKPSATEAPIAIKPILTKVDTLTAGTLSVCSDVPYPPFEDFDKSSPVGFKGFDIDIVAALAETYGLKLQVKDSSFDALQSGLALKAGECDLAASAMTITPERQKQIDFSDAYYDSEQSLLVPEGSDIKSIADLDGKTVGVQKGTTGESYTEKNAKGAKVTVFPSDGEMWPALQGGSVDALLQDLPVNLEHTKEGGYTIVEKYDTNESYGLAMAKGSKLVAPVNEALKALRDSGRYKQIYDTYFAVN